MMSQTMSRRRISPLEQTRRADRVEIRGDARQLSPTDQASLKTVLHGKYEFVDNEAFYGDDPERAIFDEAPEIQKPNTSWYHPVIDNVGDDRSLGRSPGTVLLTAAEERALFLQFNYCRYRVVQLKEKLFAEHDVDAPPADLARDLLHWHARAEAYRDQIAQTNLALVLAMAKRTRMSEVDFSDLVSEGNMALLRAVDKFDAARGFKFSTYACRAILKAFSRIGVKVSKYRNLFPTEFDPKLERSDYMERRREEHEDDCVDEVKFILQENRAELTQIERDVLKHRFAVAMDREAGESADASPLTLEQVGKIIGVTKERVRQIQNKALEKMRETLERDYLN